MAPQCCGQRNRERVMTIAQARTFFSARCLVRIRDPQVAGLRLADKIRMVNIVASCNSKLLLNARPAATRASSAIEWLQ